MRLLPMLSLLMPCLAAAAGARPASNPCPPAIAAAERASGSALGLLAAVGVVESGRFDPATGGRQPWPWTVTAEGVGTFYPSKAEAVAAVQALRARGVASIDVGCMQVNLQQHPAAFASLDQAFEPRANTAYAARFLNQLYARLGTWLAAAAGYHSMTRDLGAQYARLISAVWAGAPVPVTGGHAPGVEVVIFPGGGEMRVFRDATAGGRARVIGTLTGPG